MAVFWVQHYYTLPVIFEDLGMGDELPHRHQHQLTEDVDGHQRVLPDTSSRPTQAMDFAPYPAQALGQTPFENVPSSFNMSNMASTLPDYHFRNYGQQPLRQPLSSSPNSNLLYQMQQSAQLTGQNVPIFNSTVQQQYAVPGQQQQPHTRGTGMHYSQFGGSHQFPQPSGQQAGLQHIQAQYPPHAQQFYQQPGSGTYGQSYVMRGGAGFQMGQIRHDSSTSAGLAFSGQHVTPRNLSRRSSDSSLRVSVPRGPPRKPKQSGHALWVGNLPPGTQVVDLKDHFSRDATEEIESVFLISKSNCAFVNYKTEASCAAAMSRFHDSRYQGVRLVCRLRRGSTPLSANPPSGSAESQEEESKPASGGVGGVASSSGPGERTEPELGAEKVKEKYFIVKSLTIEDLELSARNGTWATQAHNEVTLNKAYQSAENVYLVFSANKSGEYFGYARMASNIDDEQTPVIQQPQRPEVQQRPSPSELPITIPTPATATAPKGHIIDDSARGTIFWEAEVEEVEGQRTEDAGNTSGEGEDVSAFNPQAFGKPFRIEWLSTERLPFYRTRGLRNPWNSNREVKIARDGTELEPSVGRRLISMFHRPQMPSLSPISARISQQSQQGYSRPY